TRIIAPPTRRWTNSGNTAARRRGAGFEENLREFPKMLVPGMSFGRTARQARQRSIAGASEQPQNSSRQFVSVLRRLDDALGQTALENFRRADLAAHQHRGPRRQRL